MKTGRGWWALAGVVAGSVLLLLSGYVGAYYAMAERGHHPVHKRIPGGGGKMMSYYPVWYPHRVHETATLVFSPLHQIDRNLIRPQFWDPPKREFIIIDVQEFKGLVLPPPSAPLVNLP